MTDAAADLLSALQASYPTFDATVFEGGQFAPTLTALGLPTSLTLAPASVDGWTSPDDATVTLSGTLVTEVLGVSNAPLYFQFTNPTGSEWIMAIDVALPSSWTFATSFPLFDGGILAGLTLDTTQPAELVIASAAVTDANPALPAPGVDVAAGLSFYGALDPNASALTQVAWILDGAVLQTTGPIGYTPSDGAVTMSLALATVTVSGIFGSGSQLDMDVSLSSGLNAALGQYEFGVEFAAAVAFEPSDAITVSALLTWSQQPILDLGFSGTCAFPSTDTLATYFGATSGSIPAALPTPYAGGTNVDVNAVTFGIGLQSKALEYAFLSVAALQGNPWDIWDDVLTLEDVVFVFAIFSPFGATSPYSFDFAASCTLGGVTILIQAQLPAETLSGKLDPSEPPPSVATFVSDLFGTSIDIPADLVVSKLDFAADLGASTYTADLEITGDWSIPFGTDNDVVFEDLSIGMASDGTTKGTTGTLTGAFAINTDNAFSVELDISSSDATFDGSWKDEGTPLTYQDIAIALGMYGLATLPTGGLNLDLVSASFSFDTQNDTFEFDVTTTYGEALLVAGKDATSADWGFVYGMVLGLGIDIDLTDIPVVGNLVPSGLDVIAINDLRCVAATTTLPTYTATTSQQQILGSVVNSGIALSIDVQVGSLPAQTLSVAFGGTDDGTASDTPPSGSGSSDVVLAAPADPSSGSAASGPLVTWMDVQRSFGPVQINRVGFTITTSGDLGLEVDGGVSLDGLSIGLTGLEAAIPLSLASKFEPKFTLQGLEVQYSGGGLTIGGGLQAVAGAPSPDYEGELEFRLDPIGATVMAGYEASPGDPKQMSLFAFMCLEVPLGGPAGFFVTGLSGGFGYNSSLKLPTVADVSAYPLVEAATGGQDAKTTENELQQLITVEQNENWFALGVAFTSWEMVKSYGLLTVAFGPDIEIGLIGQSTISVPVSTPEASVPLVAEAGMDLVVDIAPSTGVVSVSAQISPSSWVLSTDAHITGGFAFYFWFDPSPYAGDFVITLGGYNPHFTPPSYYPVVPLLGMNWQMSSELSAKGGLYFALTPSAIMAGGSFDASWQSSGVKAWFDADADFAIRYKPFTYGIDLSLSVGASLTMDLLVTRTTISVSASANVSLWGPPFGGKASVDLCVFSVDLSFGTSYQAPEQQIGWPEFSQTFLPPAGSTVQAPPAVTPTNSLITINAVAGLVSTATSGTWTVDPAALTIGVGTSIPSVSLTVAGTAVQQNWTDTTLVVGPMGADGSPLNSSLSIVLTRDSEQDPDDWTAIPVLGSVPSALWLNTTNSMTGGLVPDALVGVTLVPTPPVGAETLPVPIAALKADDAPVWTASWSAVIVATSDGFDQEPKKAMSQMQDTLVAGPVAIGRSAILAALGGQGMSTWQTVDVEQFATLAPDLLSSSPTLRYLGETPVPA